MLWVKAFHIIAIVTWFAGLFYLPRLFVYHAMSNDEVSNARFKIMERKLYRGITLPSAIVATLLGLWLYHANFEYYRSAGWMHVKLAMVVLLWGYQGFCARYMRAFANDNNQHGHVFYRVFNEIPVVMLVVSVIMVIVRPF